MPENGKSNGAAQDVFIVPPSAEELAKRPKLKGSTDDERKAALADRHNAEARYVQVEVAHAKERIAALNIEVAAPWQKEIQGYERSLCHCGELLAILTESEEPLRTRKINKTVVITKLAVMHATPEHTMFLLLMDDGSAHETLTCRKCARAALAGELNLERLYAFDLAKWLHEPGGAAIVARYARRRPMLAVREGEETES